MPGGVFGCAIGAAGCGQKPRTTHDDALVSRHLQALPAADPRLTNAPSPPSTMLPTMTWKGSFLGRRAIRFLQAIVLLVVLNPRGAVARSPGSVDHRSISIVELRGPIPHPAVSARPPDSADYSPGELARILRSSTRAICCALDTTNAAPRLRAIIPSVWNDCGIPFDSNSPLTLQAGDTTLWLRVDVAEFMQDGILGEGSLIITHGASALLFDPGPADVLFTKIVVTPRQADSLRAEGRTVHKNSPVTIDFHVLVSRSVGTSSDVPTVTSVIAALLSPAEDLLGPSYRVRRGRSRLDAGRAWSFAQRLLGSSGQ